MISKGVAWHESASPVPYPESLDLMKQWSKETLQTGQEHLWFLEHPPLYTAGTSASEKDYLGTHPFPVYQTGRGGQMTYHGPGQRVLYLILDLKKDGQDLRHYIWKLEEWIISTLLYLGLEGFRREGRVGIWTFEPSGQEAKIAAIGVRVSRWITSHGIAFNVHPNLDHFRGIIPCGLNQHGVTSLHALGYKKSLHQVDIILRERFEEIFQRSLIQEKMEI